METALFYDTETTGLPLFKEPSEHPDQPHIVQLGACLVDLLSRKVLASLDVIVRPDGWTIPEEAAKVHGITTEKALDVGIPERMALEMFLELWRGRTRIAHNEQFDARIIRIGLKRHIDPLDPDLSVPVSDDWKNCKAAECTATLSTPVLKLPPTEKMRAVSRFHHKTPNLGEAYRHFTGRELEGAHSAIVDVQACMDVWFGIQALRAAEPAAA